MKPVTWAVVKARSPAACTASIRQTGRLPGGARRKAAKAIHRKARADTALVLSSRTGMTGGASGRSRNAVNMLTTLSVTIAAPIRA